ncbi:uncharacterized protein LOC132563632 [Ylistrum balloti]|uniref:uncharacterized protein LOC132563632 n=1 Tax=Ylistrum balloti TaxID=509963 RepID=UPI0029058C11|nr:uncharacterized protein LOC132563632 [Ylistrum balloti]
MTRTLLIWSLLSVVKIASVACGQYQRVPEEFFQPSGNDSQILILQLVVCSPNKPEGQTSCSGLTACKGQTKCQGLILVSNCSLQINSTTTELFFTNMTDDKSDDPDFSTSYYTLMDFSATNNSIHILPHFEILPNLLLKGAFTFDLKCNTPEDEKVSTTPNPSDTNPGTPIPRDIIPEIYWIITIALLAALSLLLFGCLIYLYKRKRSDKKETVQVSTYNCHKRSKKDNKEEVRVNSQYMETDTHRIPKFKLCSENQAKGNKKLKNSWKSRFNVNCKYKEDTKKSAEGREGREVSTGSREIYIPMAKLSGHTSKQY